VLASGSDLKIKKLREGGFGLPFFLGPHDTLSSEVPFRHTQFVIISSGLNRCGNIVVVAVFGGKLSSAGFRSAGK